jgi:hypothetical protein
MSTEQVVKYSVAALLIVGYAAVFIAYIWAPHGSVADDKVVAALIGALTSGYLLAVQSVFK